MANAVDGQDFAQHSECLVSNWLTLIRETSRPCGCKFRHTICALRLLLLGAAGTGKTYTAKVGITEVRLLFGSYDSVLTMASTGVASANLGTGSRTIDSVFHTNREDAVQDLTGDALDNLVSDLESVELLVIDEISTCGAAPLEVVSRRMQQVARVVWRKRFRSR